MKPTPEQLAAVLAGFGPYEQCPSECALGDKRCAYCVADAHELWGVIAPIVRAQALEEAALALDAEVVRLRKGRFSDNVSGVVEECADLLRTLKDKP